MSASACRRIWRRTAAVVLPGTVCGLTFLPRLSHDQVPTTVPSMMIVGRARYGRDGISQEMLGTWLGLTQAQVSRIENGPPIRNLDTLAHWARVLRIPVHLLWFKLPV